MILKPVIKDFHEVRLEGAELAFRCERMKGVWWASKNKNSYWPRIRKWFKSGATAWKIGVSLENLCDGPCLWALDSYWIRKLASWLCYFHMIENLTLPIPRTSEDQVLILHEPLIILHQTSTKAFLSAEAIPSVWANTASPFIPLANYSL